MRKHVLRIMKLETDKHLPDSHVEGDPLPDDGAVRFIWEKTPKQSAHNNTMKKRAIITLKERRARKPRLYKFISDSDFKEKRLEDTFDQVFTTLRQKFKAQRDELAAVNHKRKEDHKAMKVRRLSRKKTV